ncbi:MAG: chromosome segregation protein SMC [Halothiobacillaceae bacterium]
MRLATLRLAGFKSFVEPTELRFPSELVGIVGPNGCGKSNTLDALRWVMGESSAKNLRGQSLDDVIFAGSGQRKAMAQASVELVFEHHADDSAHLQGPWARFSDLSIRRVATRDGQSKYFLNGTRCRRKDIADLFLGTGLGRGHGASSTTRSYAIIEQGQINRLLDARPDELRATLEEAAGISRYKERRRETENSILHTRDNLARLSDIRNELSRQLDKLERQAKAAERFREWQHEAALLETALSALQLQQFEREREQEMALYHAAQTELESAQQQQHHDKMQLDSNRAQEAKLQADLHQSQAQAYALAAKIAQLEQTRRHSLAQAEQLERELAELAQEIAQHHQQHAEATSHLSQLEDEIAAAQDALSPLNQQVLAASQALAHAEYEAQEARQTFERLQSQAQEPAQQLRVEQSQLSHSEQQQRSLNERLQRQRIEQLMSETQTLEQASDAARIAHQECSQRALALEASQDSHAASLALARQTLSTCETEVAQLQAETQGIAAEQRALQAVEHAQNNNTNPALRTWLQKHGLNEQRAALHVNAAAEWLTILDTVLKDALNATPVDTLDAWLAAANEPATHGLCLVEKNSRPPRSPDEAQRNPEIDAPIAPPAPDCHPGYIDFPAAPDVPPLLEGDYAQALLNGLRPCASLEIALAHRHELHAGETWLTPQGDRVSRHVWQRPPAAPGNHGTLQRRQRLEQLAQELAHLNPRLQTAREQLQHARLALSNLEAEHRTQQRTHTDTLRQQGELALRAEQLRQKLEQSQNRLHIQRREQTEINAELLRNAQRIREQQQRVSDLERLLQAYESELHAARRTREHAEEDSTRQRQGLRTAERTEQAAHAHVHALQREHTLRSQALTQLEAHTAQLNARQHALLARQSATLAPQTELETQLEHTRSSEQLANKALEHARDSLAQHIERTRSLQQALMQSEQNLEHARNTLESRRLRLQALELRAEVPANQLANIPAEHIKQALEFAGNLDIQGVQNRLHETQTRISRLGAVNLAALEEYTQAREQHDALEAQHNDLHEALATLETAMRTMDQETRGRFRETFEAVNTKLSETFQQLFGGGEARLELQSDSKPSSDDESNPAPQDPWLANGVVLLARPPGKKISHLHLLSGGEKSLTAIALIFAIFQLNPAPFCLLDEVDAPLDEANVGRFCAMVQAMSARVQFIFITHNKTTMELARHLIGVTMREAGVSRIVEVDLDAAVKMLNE